VENIRGNKKSGQGISFQPSNWKALFLAGLPHFLVGLLFATEKLGLFYFSLASLVLQVVIGIGLCSLVIGMLWFAWRDGWPLWSASWYMYGVWAAVVVMGLLIDALPLEDAWRYTNALFFGWIVFCSIGYLWLLVKAKMHALLAVLFLFPFLSIILLEFIPNPVEGVLAISLGMLAALVAAMILWFGDFRSAFILVLGFNILVGFGIAYISEYKMLDLPQGIPAHIPTISNYLQKFAIFTIPSLTLILLPFIIQSLWNFWKQKREG